MAKRKSSPSPQPPPEAAQAATGGAHPGAQVVPPRVLTGPADYVTYDTDRQRAIALANYGQALQSVEPGYRTHGSDIFLSIGTPGVGARDGFDRRDYDSMRQEEKVPSAPKDVIRAVYRAYDEHGIVRNTVDLQSDLVVQGIDWEHSSPAKKRFMKEWFRRVSGIGRSGEFAKQALLSHNVLVRRHVALLSEADERRLQRSQSFGAALNDALGSARPDIDMPQDPATQRRAIPMRYTFLNPLTVDLADEIVAAFVGPESFRFFLDVPSAIVHRIRNPRNDADRALIASLPDDLIASIKTGGTKLMLDPDKVSAFYLKRNDWDAWATPALRSILPDLQILRKMKLADVAALDGAISSIRVWKLGSLEHRILPPASVMLKLAQMLTNNVGGGVMDLVWGPDIELLETNTDVHQFLGDTKYAPCLNFIFQGLGVPPTLNGTGQGGQQGYTNNSISMRTFTERLGSIRALLKEFWEGEARRVQIALGWRRPATLVFDGLFTDQAAERALYIQLADRDIISVETVQEMFGAIPEIEMIRLKKQKRREEGGKVPRKAGPYHSIDFEKDVLKILAQTGDFTPSELGLEMDEAKDGEEAPNVRKAKTEKKYGPKPAPGTPGNGGGATTTSKPKGTPGQGRPRTSKDSGPRKQKAVKPKSGAAASDFLRGLAVAENQLADIARLTRPAFLRSLGKKTERELTNDESERYELWKFALLANYRADEAVTEESLRGKLSSETPIPAPVFELFSLTRANHTRTHERPPTIEAQRRYQAGTVALYREQCIPTHQPGETDTESDSGEA